MSLTDQMDEILRLLAGNIQTSAQPSLMRTERIAGELALTVTETKQLLRTMHAMGTIECCPDCNYSLITSTGLRLHRPTDKVHLKACRLENSNDHYSSLSF